MQLPKVNACRTSTVATTTTLAFPNDGSVTVDRIAVWETMNSVALDAGTKNSAVKTRIDVCQRGGDVTDHVIAPMAPMNAIVHPIKVRGGCEK